MKFSESLKKNEQFREVYKKGKSLANKYLVVYVLENNQERNYLGISVSKKVGNSVVRHRVKRLIRESHRLTRHQIADGYDIVVIARNEAANRNYHDIERAFLHLAAMHRIKKKETV